MRTLGAALLLVAATACTGYPGQLVEGQACVRSVECGAGLACVQGLCTADTTGIGGNVPSRDAATPEDADSPMDASTPDTSTPMDASAPMDASMPDTSTPMDASEPPEDASEPMDASEPPEDASEPMDGGDDEEEP